MNQLQAVTMKIFMKRYVDTYGKVLGLGALCGRSFGVF